MRCLLVSDLHYALKQFDWVVRVAHHFDVVVLAGDHLDIASTVDLRTQITVVNTYVRHIAAKTRTIVCSGNHDLEARNADGEKFARWVGRLGHFGGATDFERVEFGGALFTICPWWDGPLARERVEALFAADAGRPKTRWIWIYHAPPAGSPTSWGGKQDFGDGELVGWIDRYRPDMVLCGHIHQSPFKADGSWVDRLGKTWSFNPGRQIGPCPTHIVIDTDECAAYWFSLAGVEHQRLDEAPSRPVQPAVTLPSWLRAMVSESRSEPGSQVSTC